MSNATIHTGDCLEILPTLEAGSVDCVITDPPYPEIDREYGRWTEAKWHALMDGVVGECRRVLKPQGSAVFILQPNSERVGRMRLWLWEFVARWGRAWGLVQDAYWWNHACPPARHSRESVGLLRGSVKWCVWFGSPDCHRQQGAVLWTPSDAMAAENREDRALRKRPSGVRVRRGRIAATVDRRGGSTPFNLLPLANSNASTSSAAHGHGAGTPLALCEWWTRYLCPAGGLALDPFCGAGTMGIAALSLGCRFVGVERDAGYADIARRRVAESAARYEPSLFDAPSLAPAEANP